MSGVAGAEARRQFLDNTGNPLNGGLVDVYLAGTTTRTNTWQDRAQTTLNTNPIVLDSAGRATIVLDVSLSYKYVVKTSAGVVLYTEDNITANNQASLVGFLQAGSGAVARTAQDKMRERVSVKDFGAVGDGVADDTAAIQAAITYCASGTKTRDLLFPNGVYKVTATLDFATLRVIGEGVLWQQGKGSIIRAGAADILVAKMTATGQIENLSIDGNNLALWGLMVSSARPRMHSVEVVRCKEYGVVMNAAQNGAFYNLNARQNGKAGLVMANGTRNCNFYNYTSSVENGPDGIAAAAESVCIRWLIDLTNPHGFGLTNAVTTVGNDRNNFFGGISETFNQVSGFVMDTSNPNAWVGQNAGNNFFYGYELSSGQKILSTDATFSGAFHFFGPTWLWKDDATMAASGTAGTVLFYGTLNMSGGGNFAQHGVTQSTNLYRLLKIDVNEAAAVTQGLEYYLAGGGGAVAFNAATKTFSVTGGGTAVQGLGLNMRGAVSTAIASTMRDMRPVLRITFNLANVVGGAGVVGVYMALSAAPFRRSLVNIGAGTYQYLYKCQGDEAGGVEFTYNGVTSFDVSDVRVEVL